jgi:hypothetical protein
MCQVIFHFEITVLKDCTNWLLGYKTVQLVQRENYSWPKEKEQFDRSDR